MKRLALIIALMCSPLWAQDDGFRSIPTPVASRVTTPAAVHAQLKNVCRVRCGQWAGSGVYIGDGIVVSAWHVLRDGNYRGKIHCEFPFAGTVTGRFVNADSAYDICTIKLDREPHNVNGVPIAKTDLKVGDVAVSAGYSSGRLLLLPGRVVRVGKWMDIDNAAASGDSGGPVFNEAGEFVGPLWGSDGGSTVASNHTPTCKLLARIAGRIRDAGG